MRMDTTTKQKKAHKGRPLLIGTVHDEQTTTTTTMTNEALLTEHETSTK
jgi:hypothetical protein